MLGVTTKAAPPALWPYLLVCAGVAVWIDLGTLHRAQHSDSLLNILASLYAWTPFFWEQDRYGALLPLLASPIKDPLLNLLVQDGISVWCGLAAVFLLARYLFRNGFYPAVAVLANAAFLTLASEHYRFEFFADTCYGVPFSLGFAALLLTEPVEGAGRTWSRRALGLVLMLLAHWVFLAVFLTLAPLALLRCLLAPMGEMSAKPLASRTGRLTARAAALLRDPEARWSGILLAAGLIGGMAFRRLAGWLDPAIPPTDFSTCYPSHWPAGWAGLARRAWDVQGPSFAWPLFLLAAAAGGALLCALTPSPRRRLAGVWCAAGILLATASAGFLFMGTRSWTALNLYDFRYSMPALLLVQVAAVALLLGPLYPRLAVPSAGRRGSLLAISAVLLCAAAWHSYGRPSVAGVRADLDRALGGYTDDIRQAGCTHVAGDYWFVWKTVFHVNLTRHERGEREVIWGVAHRAGPSLARWRQTTHPPPRVAARPDGEDEASRSLAAYGLPPAHVVEKRDTIWVMEPDEQE